MALKSFNSNRLACILVLPGVSAGSTKGNFFPIVVFYSLGALIGCYAPIG